MQRLLATADWNPDLVRDDLRAHVVEQLGDPGAVLMVDETGGAPRGAEERVELRDPPSVIAVAG
jgi:hypothetical protein